MKKEVPILEYDDSPVSIIEPSRIIQKIDIPSHCVICFFTEVIEKLVNEGKARLICNIKTEAGLHPVYEAQWGQKPFVLFHPGLGGPMAVILLEKVIALGAGKFIACGGAGVLEREIAVGQIIIPYAAIRDEGVSYHYLAPSREVEVCKEGLEAVERVLKRNHCQYKLAKTWTTDAFFRETMKKVQLRKSEGCLTVEMECASFFAVAKFRGVPLAQILYGGDDVSCAAWDSRRWNEKISVRENLFWLAAEVCLEL